MRFAVYLSDQQKGWRFFLLSENPAQCFQKLFAEVTGRAGFVRTVRVELALNYDTESNKTVQVDLPHETTKSVLRRNNNYQRVKNGLIQRVFNLRQVWQTLIEPYPPSVCRLPQQGALSKCGWMWYLGVFISKGNGRNTPVNRLYIRNLKAKWSYAAESL